MDYLTARALVIADQRTAYPDMTDGDAIAHAVNTLTQDTLTPYTAEDDGQELADLYTAYSIVLFAHQD